MVKLKEASAPPLYPPLPQSDLQVDSQPTAQVDSPTADAAPDAGETFRLKRISDIREFLENEVETRGRYRRRYKSAYNSTVYTNAGCGLASLAFSGSAVATTATGIGIVIGIPLGITAAATGALGVISAGIGKIFLKKVEKHQEIKSIAESKLSSINGLVSTALQDGHISNEEYQIILQEEDNYRQHKSHIRNRITADVKALTIDKESQIREESLKKGIQQGREMTLASLQTMMKQSPPP